MDLRVNAVGKRVVIASHGNPIVARRWFGRARAEHADEYLRYNYENGALEVEKKPGCLGMQQFRRIEGDVAEFATVSYWESMEAMEKAHGEGLSPTHLERDPEYLLELPDTVEIAELHANDWLLETGA